MVLVIVTYLDSVVDSVTTQRDGNSQLIQVLHKVNKYEVDFLLP